MESARQRHYRDLALRCLPYDDDEDAGEPGRYLLVRRQLGQPARWLVTFPEAGFIGPYLRRHPWAGWAIEGVFDLDSGEALDLERLLGRAS